jgi:hypothetical protein
VNLSVCVALPAKLGNFKFDAGISVMSSRSSKKRAARRARLQEQYVLQHFMCSQLISSTIFTVIMTPTIINCLRSRQSVAFRTRFSSRYLTPFDNPSNVSFVTRGLGTAKKAGSNSHMYAENGDSSCSHRLHVCTYGSSSRYTDLEWGSRHESYDVSRPSR